MSVLVDVRQGSYDPKDVMDPWPTMVGLYSLDECVGAFGKSRKPILEGFIGNRDGVGSPDGFSVGGDIQKQRELTSLLPVGGERDPLRIGLDEIERKVIKRRSELINNLSSNDLDIGGSIYKEIDNFFTIRIFGDDIRVLGTSQLVDDRVNEIDLCRYPSEFEFGRRYAADR
jgi:hypothetical protein